MLSVDPEHAVDDIRARLLGFLTDPDSYRRIGHNGRFALEEEHAPEHYVEALLAPAAEARSFRPSLAALKLADRVDLELKTWPVAAARLAAGNAAIAIKSLCWREAQASQASAADVSTAAPASDSGKKCRARPEVVACPT